MLTQGSVSLPQGDIYYLKNRHSDDQPWIWAIHGWLDNAASFVPLMAELEPFNWVAIDLPGHGHSFHRPAHSHYHFIDWVTDLVSFHRHFFNGQKVYLVGHSLGGMLSTVLAGLYPELVEKLVLIDAAGLVTQEGEHQARNMRKALDSRFKLQEKSKTIHPTLKSAVAARLTAGDLSRSSAELLVERNIEQTQAGFEWRTDQRLRTGSPVRINRETASDIIKQIEAEILITVAESGYDMVKRSLKLFQSDYRQLRVERVAGGHHCHMDQASAVARQLSAFL